MTLTLDYLPNPASPLARLDPRWKLATVGLAVVAVTVLRSLSAVFVALAGAWALAALARLPLRWYLARIGAVLLFLLLFVILLPFLMLDPSQSQRPVGLHFSWYGLEVALVLCLKAVAIITLMLVLLTSAPLDATLKAAHALRVPGLLIQLTTLTYRYIFLLAAEFARLRIALRVRGYRNRATRHSYRTIGHVAGALLVRGYERAERVGHAMRCRGFDGRFRALTGFRTRFPDIVFFIAVIGCAVALLCWDFANRLLP